jgi:hypothetical protein
MKMKRSKVENLKKRTWHYVMKPAEYGMRCDKCDGANIEWSEFEHKIWCYDCQIDTRGFEGIFGGPIGIGISKLLGLSFDRWNMLENRVEYFSETEGNNIEWLPKPTQNA